MIAEQFTYVRERAVAMEAVRLAAALLREEYHREGGPRCHNGHCPVDLVVEHQLAKAIREAFPGDQIHGEEHYRARADHGRCWVIDPHDGTSRFAAGERGSAISVALLVDREPVLGVVCSPTYPDDDGDSIAWAKGCSLARNGAPLDGIPLRPERALVILSTSERRQARTWAQRLAPTRIRFMPSIAYRLALVAMGEATATLTTHPVAAFDVAAGHAILRGVGLDLYDGAGHPLRYGPRDQLPSCLGGDLDAVVRLTGCQSDRMTTSHPMAVPTSRPKEAPDLAPLTGCQSPAHGVPDNPPALPWLVPAQPRPGGAWRDAKSLSRAQGCLMGLLAGDNLGALVEFATAAEVAERYPTGPENLADGGVWGLMAGQPTDDGEQALCMARTLIAHGADPERLAEAYAVWFDTAFDIGGTTRAALGPASHARRLGHSALAAAKAHGNEASQANGALMRVAPLGIYGHALLPSELIELARADAAITHPHPICKDASAIYVIGIAAAMRGLSAGEVLSAMLNLTMLSSIDPYVRQAVVRGGNAQTFKWDRSQSGWVLGALHNACFRLQEQVDPVRSLVATVRMGGDTDTTAAIAGALLGAVHGRDAWPMAWRRDILSCLPVVGAPTRHPRPDYLWPWDLEMLAEGLMTSAR